MRVVVATIQSKRIQQSGSKMLTSGQLLRLQILLLRLWILCSRGAKGKAKGRSWNPEWGLRR
ncbi:hypothetical protein Tco_0604927, partial [Tanacetum coccineum]